MNNFHSLLKKKERIVIGVLSGTSLDGIDVALVKIKGRGESVKLSIIDYESYPVSKTLKKKIIDCTSLKNCTVLDICKLNFVIGRLFADSILKIISGNRLTSQDIDLVGSHGQTIFHYPLNKQFFGQNAKSTLQIGDPSVIANQTGIVTVGDFRVADVALGGDGAPLVPYLDYILFKSKYKTRILINIGGIANATILKKNCTQDDVAAFDTGPGNMLIDALMKKYFGKEYDKDGKKALRGNFLPELFSFLIKRDRYFSKSFPKSTGREYYGEKFVNDILLKTGKQKKEDVIYTVTKFTAHTIFKNLEKFNTDEIFLSGGGANNPALFNFLKEYFTGTKLQKVNHSGINSDNKEAVLFALLANELINGIKTSFKSVTGAEKNTFLGKICIV